MTPPSFVTHIVRSIIDDRVVRQVGGHEQRMYILCLETFHVGFGQVGIQVSRQVVVAGREFEPRSQITYTLVRSRYGGQDRRMVAGAVSEYRTENR